MDAEDLEPRKKQPAKKDLTPLSVEDLHSYIAELEDEIARARDIIAAKQKVRSGAEGLFKR